MLRPALLVLLQIGAGTPLAAKTMTIFQSRLQPHMMEMVEAIMKRVPPG